MAGRVAGHASVWPPTSWKESAATQGTEGTFVDAGQLLQSLETHGTASLIKIFSLHLRRQITRAIGCKDALVALARIG